VAALKELIEDAALRQRLAERALADVLAKHTSLHQAKELLALARARLNGRPNSNPK
jgi:spore maturation protein CgeB